MICVIGTDWKNASLKLREQIMLPPQEVTSFLHQVKDQPGVAGCILLQTCSRFELYADLEDQGTADRFWKVALGLLPNLPSDAVRAFFFHTEQKACRRICEVACGLHSQILGEDQILTQVKAAAAAAREEKTTTPALETLFRLAVTAGKRAKTEVKLETVPPSSASKAVALAQARLGPLRGKRALVIGNGEMGRLTASLLVAEGCRVMVTLRSYRHGQSLVPRGCDTVPYDRRLEAMEGCDLLVSATKSPHCTVMAAMLRGLANPPRVLADLAIPRDIEPACEEIKGVVLYNLDSLTDREEEGNRAGIQQIREIMEERLKEFRRWEEGHKRYRPMARKGRVAVFAGTGEGRLLCEHLAAEGVEADAFVATDYGRAVMPELPGIRVHTGRLDKSDMKAALKNCGVVVDATHPYAAQASANIKDAADGAGAVYLRLNRPEAGAGKQITEVPDAQAAAEYLVATEGPVLLATGAKDLACYCAIPAYEKRIFPRILPDPDVLRRCIGLGYSPANLICMQGPFTHELNLALLRQTGAKWLVTKDGGAAGGIRQKLSAAEAAGARVILIARPVQEEGYSLKEIQTMLTGRATGAAQASGDRFPLFVSLAGKPCLVVGGGRVGCRRIRVLQQFGAKITAVSPWFDERIDNVCYETRGFRCGDTQGMTLVTAAADNREVNQTVARECRNAGIPVSVADSPGESSFFFPAVCRGSGLTAGVVSDGEKHRLAARAAASIRTILKELEP